MKAKSAIVSVPKLESPTPKQDGLAVEQWSSSDLQSKGILAVLDAPEEKIASLAVPISIQDEELTLHYLATRSKHWRSAKFNLAYIDGKSGKTILRKPLPNESAKPWTGVVPLSSEFVVASNL